MQERIKLFIVIQCSVRGPVQYTHKQLQLNRVKKKRKKGKKPDEKEKAAALRLDAGKDTGWRERIDYNPAPTKKRKALSKLKPLGKETNIYVHTKDGE